jgi:hypothetical protein
MIRMGAGFGSKLGRPVEAGACHVPGYEAGSESSDRVKLGSQLNFRADFSQLTKSEYEVSSAPETLKEERGGGYFES